LLHAEIYNLAVPPASIFGGFITLFADEFLWYIKLGLAFVAAFASVTWLFNTAGNLCRSSLLFNFSSFLALLLFLLIVVLAGLEFALSIMFADFCHYGPTQAVADLSGMLSTRPAAAVRYYTTCPGPNPLVTHLNKTATALAVVRNITDEAIHFYNASCTNLGALQQLQATGNQAYATSTGLIAEQACPRLQGFFTDLVNEGLCTDMLSGLFELWVVHLVGALLLFICMFFTSHVKQKCKILVLMDEEGAVKAIPLGPPLSPNTV